MDALPQPSTLNQQSIVKEHAASRIRKAIKSQMVATSYALILSQYLINATNPSRFHPHDFSLPYFIDEYPRYEYLSRVRKGNP